MRQYTRMPRFIADLPTIETLAIDFLVESAGTIQSSKLIQTDFEDDQQALNDWLDFIGMVKSTIASNKSLILLAEKPGTVFPGTDIPQSLYFYIGVRNAYGELAGKIIVDFRISTHNMTKHSESARWKHEQSVLQEIRETYPGYVKVIPRGIVVNQKYFKDYAHAEFAVMSKLDKIAETYSKLEDINLED